jgi:hypothetical protein
MRVPIGELDSHKEVSVVDITVGGPASVKMDPSEEKAPPLAGEKVVLRDRRKNKKDRRRSVREGIFVSLSVDNDRRVLRDRRKAGS